MILNAFRHMLENYEPLTAIVGDRIYPVMAQQGLTQTYLVYQQISRVDEAPDLDGPSDLITRRFQVNVWGQIYADTVRAIEAVREALNGRGVTFDGTTIADCRLELQRDDFDEESGWYGQSADYFVTYYE